MKCPDELYVLAKNKNYLELARRLKDSYSTVDSIAIFSRLTGQPFHNTHDLRTWKYYGGELSDEEFLERILKWDNSNDFYQKLIENTKSDPE